jgi:hypothetical protein
MWRSSFLGAEYSQMSILAGRKSTRVRERERERERKGSRVYTRASREIANGKIAQVDVPKTTCRQRLELVVNLSLDGKIDFTVRVDAEGVVEGRVRGRRRRRRGGAGRGPRRATEI